MRKKLALFTAAVGFLTICNVLLYTRRLKPSDSDGDDTTSSVAASGSAAGSWRWTYHQQQQPQQQQTQQPDGRTIAPGDWNLTYESVPVPVSVSQPTSNSTSPRSVPLLANVTAGLANHTGTYSANGTILTVWVRHFRVTFNLSLLMDYREPAGSENASMVLAINSSMTTTPGGGGIGIVENGSSSGIDFGANYSGNSSVDVTDATTTTVITGNASQSAMASVTPGPAPGPAPGPQLSVLNEHPFSLMINVDDLCGDDGGANLTLLILVTTAVSHAAHRQAIRDTWGSVAREQPGHVRLAFVMGKPASLGIAEQRQVLDEALVHGDVLQEDFLDTYQNLTLKTLMLLKWTQTYCPRVAYIMKTDDDMFINTANLLRYLRSLHVPAPAAKQQQRYRPLLQQPRTVGLLLGRLIRGAKPIRTAKSKYYAPTSAYPGRVYPDYLSGTAYVMSADVAARLYATSRVTPLFFFEDVYVTGVCAKMAHIVRRNHGGFVFYKRPVTGCAHSRSISGHDNTPADIRKIWKELQRKDFRC